MDICNTKKLDLEYFVYRVGKQTHMLELPEQLKVQIVVGDCIQEFSLPSNHMIQKKKTLDEVRTLANRVQQPIAAVSAVSAPQEGALQQILGCLKR